MFWFGKKKNKKYTEGESEDTDSPGENMNDTEDISGPDEAAADDEQNNDEEDISSEDDESGTDEGNTEESADVTVKISSLDDLAEFANNRVPGALQFMNKETLDAFEIRESHIRMAEVWGSISMARECSPAEYAKIMLALEIINDQDRFYVVPGLTESEVKQAIIDFCEERYGGNGKKYSSNFSKFSAFLKEQGDVSEWKAFTKEAVYDKLAEFCESNGIEFSDGETQGDE